MNCQITSNKEYDWMSIMLASECFASEQNTKTVATLSSSYVSQTSPTSCFGYYGQVWPLPSKMIMPTCRKLMFICMQKMNSIPNFFSEILQIHVFFHKELHFWGYRQVCLANLFSRLEVAQELLSNFQNFHFQKFVLAIYSYCSIYFQNAKNIFYRNRFEFSFKIYL